MSRFARRTRIQALAPEVWKALVDVEAWPTWASQFERIERLEPGQLGLGSRARVRPQRMPSSIWLVTEFEPGHHFTWASSLAPGLRIVGGHVLTPLDGSTEAEFWLEAEGAIGRLLNALLRRTVFSRNTRNATEGLRRYAEASQTAAST